MSDLLRMDHINSLPQPFFAHFYGGSEWPVFDIDVETGLLRIDVCGLFEVKHIGDVKFFRDMDGVEHDADSFYNDDEPSNAGGNATERSEGRVDHNVGRQITENE